ncbi:hypothetical protein ACQP6C_12235 [Snodgrassella alvi]|uniref:hypothetical protein n=1 Tax=Snodgrassella alvi TaxID=1196083 RepID=UPI003CFFF109
MENIEKTFSLIKSLGKDKQKKIFAKADKIFQESMEERQLRMKTVDADKAFDELLKKPEILNVFIRLRDK